MLAPCNVILLSHRSSVASVFCVRLLFVLGCPLFFCHVFLLDWRSRLYFLRALGGRLVWSYSFLGSPLGGLVLSLSALRFGDFGRWGRRGLGSRYIASGWSHRSVRRFLCLVSPLPLLPMGLFLFARQLGFLIRCSVQGSLKIRVTALLVVLISIFKVIAGLTGDFLWLWYIYKSKYIKSKKRQANKKKFLKNKYLILVM